MKAALVTSQLSALGGGVSAVVEALSRRLVQRDNDVQVFGLRDAPWDAASLDWRGAPASALSVVGPAAFGFAPAAARALKSFDPRIVHTHGLWTYPSHAVAQWSAKYARPFIVSPHGMLDSWAMKRSRWKKRCAGWLYENRHLNSARCIHALCDAEERAIRALGFKTPISVIPNGVDLPGPARDCAPPWAGRVPTGTNVMLYLGRLHPKKNLSSLLNAWSSAANARWHLVIAGWGETRHVDELKSIASRCDNGCIHFVGPLFGAEKDAAFRHAQAFVLPSVSEGLPMAVLEAWSYGVPVLMTDACNLPVGFSRGAAMRLGLPPQEMAEDLRRFLDLDPSALHEIGRNGRRLVETDFSWDTVADQMMDVYRWVVFGGMQPASVRVI